MKDSIGDQTNIGINLRWLLQLVTISVLAAWAYFQVVSRVSEIEVDILRMRDNVHMNSDFRIKWPLGELGALPDDAEQNLRLKYMEADIQILKNRVDDLRIKDSIKSNN
jgi:hypothetical protein